MKHLSLLFALFLPFLLSAQTALSPSDSNAFFTPYNLAKEKRRTEPKKGKQLAQQAYLYAQKIGHKGLTIRSLNLVGDLYRNEGENQKAIQKYQEALAIALEQNKAKDISSLNNRLGISYKNIGRYEQAEKTYHKALEIAKQENDSVRIVNVQTNLGVIYRKRGQYHQALEITTEALETAQSMRNSKVEEANLLNNLGVLFKTYEQYDSAKLKIRAAIAIHQEEGDQISEARGFNNLGNILKEEGNIPASLQQHRKAIKIRRENQLESELSASYINVGEVYGEYLGKHDSALWYLQNALEICQKYENRQGEGACYQSLASIYAKIGEADSAIFYGKKTEEIGNSLGSNLLLYEVSESLSEAYEQKEDFLNALAYYKQMNELEKKAFGKSREIEIAKLAIRHQKEMEVAHMQQAEIKQESKLERQNLYMLGGLVTLALVLLGFLLQVRAYQKLKTKTAETHEQQKQLSELNELKTRLLSVISHDLRLPIANLQGSLSLLKMGVLSETEQANILEKLAENTQNTSDFLENLLNWTKNQMSGQERKPMKFPILSTVEKATTLFRSQIEQKQLQVHTKVAPSLEVYADVDMIQLVVRNLFSNAVKFTPKGGTIEIIAEEEHQEVKLTIKDTGIGIPPKRLSHLFDLRVVSQSGTAGESGSGLGLNLCRSFIEQNAGKIWAESKDGTGSSFHFSLPKSF